jgi:hypothetical protein
MTRSTRRGAAALVVLAALAGAAGCGVGFDDEPRALQSEASTTTVVDSQEEGRLAAVLYYVREGALLPTQEDLPDRTPSTLLSALTTPPATNGLGTSIPAGTEVLGTTRDGELLIVDLSSEFDNVVGLSRQQAIGQMVLTVTQQGSVEQLEFQVDGETLTVSSPLRGDTTVVTACDFAALLASPDEALAADLPAATLAELEARRAELADTCEPGAPG